LVNLSRGGALIEVAARFPMRSSIRIKLTQSTGDVTVAAGRVAWAKVASIVDRQVNDTVAVIFDELLPENLLPDSPIPAVDDPQDSDLTAALEEMAAADDSDSPAAPVRGNLTQFPSGARRQAEAAPVPAAAYEPAAPAIAVDTRVEELRAEFEAGQRRWEDQRSALEQEVTAAAAKARVLEATLAAREEAQAQALADQQRKYEALLAEFEEQRAAATMRADALQEALQTREQAQAQALADQQARYESLTTELLATANDQQAEYQQLLDERIAELEALRARAEQHEAALEQTRAAAEEQRAGLETRIRELEARVAAAEALCLAHDERARQLQHEAEKLMSLIASPLADGRKQAVA
jgi:hypothetical protein